MDDGGPELQLGLAGYLRAVAEAVGVPAEGTTFEISDTATAYLALNRRWPSRPGRDLMLVWSERIGWMVSVETDPGEAPMAIAYVGGSDPLPEPAAVARFVVDALDHRGAGPRPPAVTIETNRVRLANDLARYIA
jgi:Family of unknown function (DUF6292)